MRSLLLALALPLILLTTAAAEGEPLARVTAAGPLEVVGEPQAPIRLPVLLENLGERPLRVEFEVVDLGTRGEWQLVEPLPVVLRPTSELHAPGNVTVNLVVMTTYSNGYVNESIAPTLNVLVRPLDEPDARPERHSLAWLVHSRGLYVPAAELPILVALVALVAFARRR